MTASNILFFPELGLPTELVRDLVSQNPWWRGEPLPVIPSFQRWPYEKLRRRLDEPIAPIVVIRGPRQIGKTTLQLQLIQSLLNEGIAPQRIIRVQFDDLPSLIRARFDEPILRIVDWFEQSVLRSTLNKTARLGRPAFLFLDEVQNLTGSSLAEDVGWRAGRPEWSNQHDGRSFAGLVKAGRRTRWP